MEHSSDIVNTMAASDDPNKIELNRSENAHDITIIVFDVTDKESSNNVKGRMGEIDKHVSDGINKLLIENKCDLASQEELSTDEAKELADSLNLTLRDECRE